MRYLILLLVSFAVMGGELSPKAAWRKMMVDGEKERVQEIERLEGLRREAEAVANEKLRNGKKGHGLSEKQEAEWAERFKPLESAKGSYIATIRLREGSCGALRSTRELKAREDRDSKVLVQRIVDEQTMIVEVDDEKFIIDGYPTGSLKAGGRAELSGAFKNLGQGDIETPSGKERMWMLEVFKKP